MRLDTPLLSLLRREYGDNLPTKLVGPSMEVVEEEGGGVVLVGREEEEEISWDEFDQISSWIFSLFSSLDTFFVDRRLPLDLRHHHGFQGMPFPPLDAPSIFTVCLSLCVAGVLGSERGEEARA